MFTQLFGHYLLNKKLVTKAQLEEGLEAKNTTKAKLGALAIDAGYMTSEQVEQVHEAQRRMDKRIGDIAVEMGYLTETQVTELLSKQKTANILLGQALIDRGYMTNKTFETALADYKTTSKFADGEMSDEVLAQDLTAIFNLDDMKNKDFYIGYIMLFVRNIVRFVGDDFAFAGCSIQSEIDETPCICSQEIKGEMSAFTAICSDEKAFTAFASRYAGETIDCCDEMAEASVGEFLNLQNGLYSVNMSNTMGVELELTPQLSLRNQAVDIEGDGLVISLAFSFGTINIVIYKK